MQIGSNSSYDIGSSYKIKLNESQTLVVEEDPLRKSNDKSPKAELEKAQKNKESKASKNGDELSADEKRVVNELAARDSEVKAHEAAHQGAGGGMTGSASYTYQQGPDGKMYAIGGEVSISSPSASTPEEAIKIARQIASAAMAAGDPSPQDFAVASSARIMEIKAQQQHMKKQQEEMMGKKAYGLEANSSKQNNQTSVVA